MVAKKVYAIDSSASISLLEINFEGQNINLLGTIPQNFKGKVIVCIEEVEDLNDSWLFLKDNHVKISENEIKDDLTINVKTIDNSVNDYYDDVCNVSSSIFDNISIFSSIDTPFVAKNSVPDSKKNYVDISKIFNIHIVLWTKRKRNKKFNSFNQVFDAYGALGFAIVDINKLDNYLLTRSHKNDLVEEFTTTELANELFDEGLIILSWGHTPWVYYLSTEKIEEFNELIGRFTNYEGIYKFKKWGGVYSVIPGNELKNWNDCKNKNWPLIEIDGLGEYVSIKLFVKDALSQSDNKYPIPKFILKRVENTVGETNPLLYSNIF